LGSAPALHLIDFSFILLGRNMQLRLECDICTHWSRKLMVTLRYDFLLLIFTSELYVPLTVRLYVTKEKKNERKG